MNFDLNEKIIEKIKIISDKYLISKILLFGSRARGDNTLTSDIDIVVYPMRDFSEKGLFVSDIDDIDTLLKIDIVFINENTDSKLIDNIESEGVLIYERL